MTAARTIGLNNCFLQAIIICKQVNDSKTEQTEIFRGERNTEQWRTVKKLGSLLGDTADIQRRKQLSIVQKKKRSYQRKTSPQALQNTCKTSIDV